MMTSPIACDMPNRRMPTGGAFFRASVVRSLTARSIGSDCS
jgi:hypothetical protein